ncbi:MAG: AMP-binding protein [Paracoccaceae bacterium]|nr:AMP-binding protein [Paracoccaceae bacterium]MDG1737421.1 AMP-binding protein [Paracoccaceae bacterium]MDG2257884.1 AMP-binding protein [Paracoccaceae bacterium]
MQQSDAQSEFWFSSARFGDQVCLLDGSESVSYTDLITRADAWIQRASMVLPDGVDRPLVGMEITATVGMIAAYVGCLRAGWPIILLPDGHIASKDPKSIVGVYQPNLFVAPDPTSSDGTQTRTGASEPCDMPDDLAVLLSTSGTTGAVKLVMLSAKNIDANAKAISDYLAIQTNDVAITTLALHYSYGMSVLNSYWG